MRLCVYFAYLWFQYKSHALIWDVPFPRTRERTYEVVEGAASRDLVEVGLMTSALSGVTANIAKPDQLAFES